MNKIQKLIVSMRIVIHLWKLGFYFSDNTHNDKYQYGLGEVWGFYRLNWEKDGKHFYSVFDIDFAKEFSEDFPKYFHMHGGKDNVTLIRVDYIKGNINVK